MSGLNKVQLIGHLGRDPESRALNSGGHVVSFSLATSETWRDKTTGERRENTQWHNIVIFNENIGKIAEQYLKKGSQCYIEGALQTRSYTDRDGVERKTTEVVLKQFNGELMLLDKQQRQAPSPDDYGATRTASHRDAIDDPRMRTGGSRSTSDLIDDDIPF